MLGSSKITSLLRTRWAGRNTVYKDITGSTNDDAKELAAAGADHGTLVVANRQDTGRGSRGRSWETPPGANIAMSLIVRPNIPIDRVPMLTLVMGLSVAEGADEAIKETAELQGSEGATGAANSGPATTAHEDASKDNLVPACGIKWPNDVVLAERKICGILTELHMNPDGSIGDVVIGVGINVNMKHEDFAESIREVAGSLLTGTGLKVDRSLVVARVMERFEENYEKFTETCDLSLLRQQYEARLLNKDRQVILIDPGRTADIAPRSSVEEKFRQQESVSALDAATDSTKAGKTAAGNTKATGGAAEETGTALGITDIGELRVRLLNGEELQVNSGEVSVRGVYGYV